MFQHFVSLGWYCANASSMSKYGARSTSGPFDWCISDLSAVVHFIETDFSDFLCKDNLQSTDGNPKEFIDIKYEIRYNHDVLSDLDKEYESIYEKYQRRVNRFREQLQEGACLLRVVRNYEELEYIFQNEKRIEDIIKKNNTNNEIVYLVPKFLSMPFNIESKYFFIEAGYENGAWQRNIFDDSLDLIDYIKNNYPEHKRKDNIIFDLQKQLREGKGYQTESEQHLMALLDIERKKNHAQESRCQRLLLLLRTDFSRLQLPRKVAIYGAGEIGKLFSDKIKDKCSVECFIDRDPDCITYKGISVVHANNYVAKEDVTVVVVPTYAFESISNHLQKVCGVKEEQIIPLEKLLLTERILTENESTDYKITDKARQIWNVELDILSVVESICKKYNLRYFALHGTLLGAVRHKGFIPWDDDLDIGMLREDYDKFLEIAKEELPKHLFLQTMFTDEDVFYNGITRIRNSDTTGIQERELDRQCNKGIWIDILPIDNSPLEDALYREKCKKVSRYNLLLQAKFYGKEMKAAPYKISKVGWLSCKLAARFFSKSYLAKKLDEAMRIGDNENCELGIFTGHCNYRQLNRADFSDVTYLDFEESKISVPVGYENYLFMVMGSDYMKLPPENEQKPKHRGIFDANRPYTEYEKVFCGMFDDVKDKKLILFGGGMMFDNYMKKFGRKYKPDFIVDNDKNKWGRFRQGIEIKSPQEILAIPSDRRKVIICSAYYPEIERQLKEMGIAEYSIYIQHIEWITDTEQRR